MSRKLLTKTLTVYAPAAKVWKVFTDPEMTRHMGGEYLSEWHVGGSISWKGLDGKLSTHGTILQLEPAKLLQHSLVSAKGKDASVITYEFFEVPFGEAGSVQTMIKAQEAFVKPLSEKKYAEAEKGWAEALAAVKVLAEQGN